MNDYSDFDKLEEKLRAQYQILLPEWLPGGRFIKNEYRADNVTGGKGKSFGINIYTFKFGDLNGDSDRGVGLIKLYSKINDISYREAFLRLNGSTYSSRISDDELQILISSKPPKKEKKTRYFDSPMPFDFVDDGEKFTLVKEHYYYDDKNEPKLCVQRYDGTHIKDSGKVTKQFKQWTKTDKGWALKGATRDNPAPLYNLPKLIELKDKPVIFVEGEKCADFLQSISNDKYAVTSVHGGVNSDLNKTDLTPLIDREIIFWPDNDESGLNFAKKMQSVLYNSSKAFAILNVTGFPPGFDAFDLGFENSDQVIGKIQSFAEVKKPINEGYDFFKTGYLAEIDDFIDKSFVPDVIDQEMLMYNYPHMKYTKRGEEDGPKTTYQNFVELMRRVGITAHYNIFKKEEEVSIPNLRYVESIGAEIKLIQVESLMNIAGMNPYFANKYLTTFANETPYNPIADWINSKPWDGVNRLSEFYSTVKTTNETLKETLIRKWMISAIAACYLPKGFMNRGVLVFYGEQGIGKTAWFKKLLPEDLRDYLAEGVTLNASDKDSVLRVLKHWLVELGELDGTFRKSDIAQLKAFISGEKDEVRPAYGRKAIKIERRTVFFASVNEERFLHDPTGSSRFWTLETTEINHKHSIDMQQVWAQVKTFFDKGESWHLSQSETELLEMNNKSYEGSDNYIEILQDTYDYEQSTSLWVKKPMAEICDDIGLRITDLTNGQMKKLAHAVKSLSRAPKVFLKIDGRRHFFVPSKLNHKDENKSPIEQLLSTRNR